MGMLVATVLEYITSWLLEVLFHAKWWDYSHAPYNLNGRIALIPSMFWGILSLLMFDVLQPAASRVIEQIPVQSGRVILGILLVVTTIDLIYTVVTTINFRKQLEALYEFKKELESSLEEIQLPSLREIFGNMTKEWSERFAQGSFAAIREAFYQRLENWRQSDTASESKLAAVEERLKRYWENSIMLSAAAGMQGRRNVGLASLCVPAVLCF